MSSERGAPGEAVQVSACNAPALRLSGASRSHASRRSSKPAPGVAHVDRPPLAIAWPWHSSIQSAGFQLTIAARSAHMTRARSSAWRCSPPPPVPSPHFRWAGRESDLDPGYIAVTRA